MMTKATADRLQHWAVVIIVALVTAIPPTVAAVAAWQSSRNTHDSVNSRMDKFLEDQDRRFKEQLKTSIEAARAQGVKETQDAKRKP